MITTDNIHPVMASTIFPFLGTITETLEIKAKHYQDANYIMPCDCALSKAAMEQFGTDYVFEKINSINIGGSEFVHDEYNHDHFKEDFIKAYKLGFSDVVVRRIVLTKVNLKTAI